MKTWSFFSDKIKILFEKDNNVFLLNSERKFCITNSRNQAMVRVLSDRTFDQAVIFSEPDSESLFLIAYCNDVLAIFELRSTEIANTWEIENGPILSQICIRGSIFTVKIVDQTLVLKFKPSGDRPYEIFKIKTDCIALDVLSFDRNDNCDQMNLLGYKISEADLCISTINTLSESNHKLFSLNDPSIQKSVLEFGKFLCFSGKSNQFLFYLIL